MTKVGLDFKKVGLDFKKVGLDFKKVGLDFGSKTKSDLTLRKSGLTLAQKKNHRRILASQVPQMSPIKKQMPLKGLDHQHLGRFAVQLVSRVLQHAD